jgi:hypothetical protein
VRLAPSPSAGAARADRGSVNRRRATTRLFSAHVAGLCARQTGKWGKSEAVDAAELQLLTSLEDRHWWYKERRERPRGSLPAGQRGTERRRRGGALPAGQIMAGRLADAARPPSVTGAPTPSSPARRRKPHRAASRRYGASCACFCEQASIFAVSRLGQTQSGRLSDSFVSLLVGRPGQLWRGRAAD